MKKIESITFTAKIVAYQNPKHYWDMTIMSVKDIIDNGNYTIEFVKPVGIEPTIIIKPK